MNKKYFSLVMNEETKEADINIFGDITSWEWFESDVSNYTLSKQLEQMGDVKQINVHINSYGGEVAEGLAIYNALKNHKAKVKTYCDGFACSIASVIFMAGDERIMSKASLLMIHNAWTMTMGNANELRKQADDLDKITQASINAYMDNINISEEELKTLLDNETWLTYDESLEMGFATSVTSDSNNEKASQSVRNKLVKMILASQAEEDEEDDENKNVNIETDNSNNDDSPNKDGEDEEEVTEEVETDGEDEETETTENDTETDTDKDGEETDEVDDPEDDEVTQRCVAFFNAIGKM